MEALSQDGLARNGRCSRSIDLFTSQIHTVFTPLVSEMQALWGSAFLLGKLPMPSLEMQEEVALWNSWTRKRYLAQGKKHAYAIYGYLAVRNSPNPHQAKFSADLQQYLDTLAKDLGIRTSRKSNRDVLALPTKRLSGYRRRVPSRTEAARAVKDKHHLIFAVPC